MRLRTSNDRPNSPPAKLRRKSKGRSSNDSPYPDKNAREERNAAFRRAVAGIPKGKVATYGQVAEAAGYPLYHRAVAQFLQAEPRDRLPWQRVVGAAGQIKLQFEAAAEQRLRLQLEGVTFRGKRANLKLHRHDFSE